MKQHITPEQLAELTPAQREALREWWRPAEGDMFYIKHGVTGVIHLLPICTPPIMWVGNDPGYEFRKAESLPLLSIGQCIEYLEDKRIDWPGELFFLKSPIGIVRKDYNGELIDALWTEIKAVLTCSQPKEPARQTGL